MRAFIGLGIPEGTKDRIIDAEEGFAGPGVILVKREALHITLHFLGDVDEGKTGLLSGIIRSVKLQDFSVSVKGAGTFPVRNPHVVYLKVLSGSSEIRSIHGELCHKLKAAGVRVEEDREFTPHVTIARIKRGADPGKIASSLDRISAMDFGSFSNPVLFLKKSVLTGEGPLYTTLFSRGL